MPRCATANLLARLTLPVLLAVMALPARAHYLELDRALVEPGRFTFGLAPAGRPFSWREDGVWRGFEVAMAEAVAEAHGLDLRLVPLPSDDLAAALARGEVDAVNSLAHSEKMAGGAMVPYLVIGDHVMILRGNPFRIRRLDDLQGRTVSATAGSTAEAFALSLNERFKESGGASMDVHSFPFHRATHVPVSMGHAAAYFVKTVSAVAISQDPHARTRMLPGAFRAVREAGFAVRAAGTDVHHAVEHAVAAMVATGRYRRLREAFELPEELSPYR